MIILIILLKIIIKINQIFPKHFLDVKKLLLIKRAKHNNKIEDTPKNESFYINYFTSRKKLKFFNVLPKKTNKEEVKSSERQKIINNNKFFFSKTNKVSNLRYDFNTKTIYPRNK